MNWTARMLTCALVVLAALVTAGCVEGGIGMSPPTSGARFGGGGSGPPIFVGGGPAF